MAVLGQMERWIAPGNETPLKQIANGNCTNSSSGNISGYAFNYTQGTLTKLAGSPFPSGTGYSLHDFRSGAVSFSCSGSPETYSEQERQSVRSCFNRVSLP
jgi:hypothetical protein